MYKWKWIVLTGGLMSWGSLAHAETLTVEALLNKCLAAYDNAKTYQGWLRFQEVQGEKSQTMTMQVKAEAQPGGQVKRSSMTMNSSRGDVARILDDGKTIYVVNEQTKTYRTAPHRPDKISGLLQSTIKRVMGVQSDLKVSKTQQGSTPMYLISGAPKGSQTKILINAQNFQMESLSIQRTENGQPLKSGLNITDQKFNAPIPASVFVWKAPAGYKKQ